MYHDNVENYECNICRAPECKATNLGAAVKFQPEFVYMYIYIIIYIYIYIYIYSLVTLQECINLTYDCKPARPVHDNAKQTEEAKKGTYAMPSYI